MKTKQCTKCGKQKLLSEFYKQKDGKYGVRGDCKKCNIKYSQRYANKQRRTIAGYLRHLFYCIKQRCDNSNYPKYKYWGGRGIKCKFRSADEFVNYVINNLQIDPHGLTIDRINNNGHYEPGNIRFVTIAENNRNKTRKEPK